MAERRASAYSNAANLASMPSHDRVPCGASERPSSREARWSLQEEPVALLLATLLLATLLLAAALLLAATLLLATLLLAAALLLALLVAALLVARGGSSKGVRSRWSTRVKVCALEPSSHPPPHPCVPFAYNAAGAYESDALGGRWCGM